VNNLKKYPLNFLRGNKLDRETYARGMEILLELVYSGTVVFFDSDRAFHGRALDGTIVNLGNTDHKGFFLYLIACPDPSNW
jgi:hypothetical protein